MDFAALMAKEIAKAKGPSTTKTTTNTTTTTTTTTTAKIPTEPTPDSNKPATTAAPKFISRREAEEARKAAYLAEQKALEEERAARAAAKRKREEDAAEESKAREEKRQRLAGESRARREAKQAEEERLRRKRLGLPELPPPGADDGSSAANAHDSADDDTDGEEDVPEPELSSKLRALGEPATLFGETHALKLRRFRRVSGGVTVPTGPIMTTLAPVEEKKMKMPSAVPPISDRKARRYLYRQLASYFNMVLREWEIALAKENNTDTFAGQAAANAMISSKETMKPLFRKFEKGGLDESILEAVVEIVLAAQERRYVDANDGYLRLSIGKAAWPIGVTMVGIHERSAREKLHDGEKGHIMGGEVTRKYLQSIKRCLTFAQVRWPPEDIRQLMG
ncbi:hypothetical protein B0T17DRAFT_533702 [Bombardia bombarda]|uniref:Pre-mRNA-splicing factor 18 n=1 Tax=Bombardia bombarda TaxID=252184 RepID=A0AA39WU23_9PEZI|nr:hypothetical protein B0T17DRAFT_533702 [Bombardia bombarda]